MSYDNDGYYHVSEERCRTCGRIGCEGGASCEAAAERRADDALYCVLCGAYIYGHGNNPDPLAREGKCCDHCNITKVIPARVERMGGSNE